MQAPRADVTALIPTSFTYDYHRPPGFKRALRKSSLLRRFGGEAVELCGVGRSDDRIPGSCCCVLEGTQALAAANELVACGERIPAFQTLPERITVTFFGDYLFGEPDADFVVSEQVEVVVGLVTLRFGPFSEGLGIVNVHGTHSFSGEGYCIVRWSRLGWFISY
ncbi:hypothetical protein AWC23_22000 [Mycobacterium saskatchewanense]|uniref:Uncharacterized protein n=1 Tax=Mycobacterium saskatchewanense TaxID=220927 RepID=A0AAJ3NME8_9MYCO|nr:hypothetical protein AWC23_22000 [Mycobacterium saskatchewanense]